MKFLPVVLLLCFFTPAFPQDEKAAKRYYEIGLEKAKDKSSFKKGIFPFSEAFPYFYKASELAKEGSDLQLKAIYKIAYLYNFASDELKPIVIKKTINGLKYLRKSNAKDSLAGEYFFRAGLAFTWDYRPDSAIYVFEEAKNIFQSLNYPLKVSDCYHAVGDVYKDNFYDYNSAESFYEKALAVNEKAPDNELNRFMISKLYYELASVNRSQHDYEKAMAYSLKDLAFKEKLNSKQYHRSQESAYKIAADIYSDIGSFDKAKELYEKAISLNRKFNDTDLNVNLAEYYFGLAEVFRKWGKTENSISFYKKAITIYNSNNDLKELLLVVSHQQLGESYLLTDHKEQALLNFKAGVQLLNGFELQKSGQASSLYASIGKYFRVINKTDSALVYCQKALISASQKFISLNFKDNPSKEDIRLINFAYEVLLLKGSLLNDKYKETKAISFANTALASFELAEKLLLDSRARLDMDNSKWGFFDSNFGLYQQVLSLLFEMDKEHHSEVLISKAFYFMESSKSKMLADAFNDTEFTVPLLASDSLVRFLDLERRNAYQLQDELNRQEGKPLEQARIRDLIVDTDRKIQMAENEIFIKYPSYIKTKYQYDIPGLNRIQNLSNERGTSIIEYFWGSDVVFGLALNKNEVVFKQLGKTDSIQSVLKSIHDMLDSDKYTLDSEQLNSFERNSYLAYRLLVKPFESVVESEEGLIVLPDGPIEQVPFEIFISSLIDPKLHKSFLSVNYLLRKHVLSYSFSSSYLLNQNGAGLKDPKMLAFGFTDGKKLRSREDVYTGVQLPGSELELRTILKEFPEGNYYYGNEVTEEQFKAKAPDFDLIHLAVHGLGDTEQNYSASLFFKNPDSINSKEDGRLHWYELFGLRLKAKLAVISSCESGIGKAYKGEGMLSMASAFAFAGSKNIVMGLWKVDDRVSADLMNDFYKNLRKGDRVDVALTKAKRSYLDRSDDLTANPKLWASLVSYGNGQVIDDNSSRTIYLLIGMFILFIIGGLFFYYKKR